MQLVFAIFFMIAYGRRDINSRNLGDEYKCIMVDRNGDMVAESEHAFKWIRAFALNYWMYAFLALFHFVGILGTWFFTLRLIAWCTIFVTNPIHLIVIIYTTAVRYNQNGRECSLNPNNTFVHDDSNFLQWTTMAQWFGLCFFCGIFNLQTELNKRYSDHRDHQHKGLRQKESFKNYKGR